MEFTLKTFEQLTNAELYNILKVRTEVFVVEQNCPYLEVDGKDSLNGAETEPIVVLDVINRIVEKSVSDSMFISMFYGTYDTSTSVFTYASAGHEPPLFYCAKSNSFSELQAKGLLLGVIPNVKYEQHSISLGKDDFVVMMTDGVTECR